MNAGLTAVAISRYGMKSSEGITDSVAVEEPLKISLVQETQNGKIIKEAGITLRTPGHDAALAIGFLFSEGILKSETEILKITHQKEDNNSIFIHLKHDDPKGLQKSIRSRKIFSACGFCGQNPKDDLLDELPVARERGKLTIEASLFFKIREQMDAHQSIFRETGGLHAAAIFNLAGESLLIREDIGRHNALDKIIGSALLEKKLPFNNSILLLSGRAGYELIQKAAQAGIPVIASIGAPSSLAIQAAEESKISLVGFLRNERFNLYTCFDNIIASELNPAIKSAGEYPTCKTEPDYE